MFERLPLLLKAGARDEARKLRVVLALPPRLPPVRVLLVYDVEHVSLEERKEFFIYIRTGISDSVTIGFCDMLEFVTV